MSSSRAEILELIKTRTADALSVAKQGWQSAGTMQRRIAGAALVSLGMCGIYAFSKGEEAAQTKVLTSREADFKKARILGDPYATSGRAKEQLLSKNAKEYSDTQKLLLEGLTQINSRMDLIERRVAGGGAENTVSQTVAVPDSGPSVDLPAASSTETNGASGQTSPVHNGESARDPIDMRAHIPMRYGAPGYSRYGSDDAAGVRLKAPKGPPVVSFPVQGVSMRERAEMVLPVGSYVKAKLLTGVEAPEGNPYPVLLQLDFASILPNKKSLDLRGCFMIAKAQGDLSTERVQMQATKLSCVSKGGQMFERDINGFVADAADNSFAVIGTVNTKQDRVAAMAFLSSVVEGVGKAIQMAQTSEQTASDGTSKTTLTGNQGKYIAAGGAGSAAGMVAQWYLKQAQSLLPTINVGSGQDIWVVMNETVALPHEYFKKVSLGESHGNDYSLVNRLFD